MSVIVNDKNYFFIPPSNKNDLSTSLPSDFHKAKSFEFICDVEVNVDKHQLHYKLPGYIMSLNGKHLGIFASHDFIGASIWTENGEEKIIQYPKDMRSKQQIHFICNLEEKYIKLNGVKKSFKGKLVNDYRYSYLWIGCGNGLNDDAKFQFYGKMNSVKIIKNNKTIFKTDFKQKTKFKVFDQSNCGNHLIKYKKDWFE